MSDITDTSRHGDAAFQEELSAALTDRTLHLILLPTEQCNFRCTYCYEDFAIGRMAQETINAVKLLLDRRFDGLQGLDIAWFGGEPLLARAVVEEISAHVVASVADKPDLLYRGDMTTNGYLLDVPAAEKLAELGVTSYQISLDGPEAVHDTTRVRRNGGASFQRIWQNLLAIRDSGLPVRILLRMHLTPKNLPSMPDFVRRVRDTFLDDSRFSVSLKPVERMGGPNDATMETLSRQARAEALGQLKGILEPGSTASGTPAGPAVCYAARPNSLVIRANGSIAKCTVALSDPSNTVGRLAPDGTLHVDNARLGPWLRGWSEGNWASVGCPYVGMPRMDSQLLQIGTGPHQSRDARQMSAK
ncbi:radical SAM protein [Streptomyces europaeiscabiei]|uniref:radical SAM protein n=1 Tax=Streptomyces europaeiscabiei TaxID=146819 RepID=UPI0029A8E68D|nr:radical SAM protein [Streptomyces europaeiscabiei]MDX3698086.1 radical SAM protein [Streptomyces europaeiscabiei]